ncbi:MAG: hypothetical protein ABI304_12905 [Rudaea sp.]
MKRYAKPSLAIALACLLALGSGVGFARQSKAVRADVTVVHALYDEFAGEAVLEDPETQKPLLDQSRVVLLRYFTPELSALILRDRECAARTREVCNLDFLPIWDSQDPMGATVKMAGEPAVGKVRATIRYANGEKRILIFRLAQTSVGWRIADVIYAGDKPTLAQILRSAQ